MDQNVKWFYETRAKATLEALSENRISGTYVSEKAAVKDLVMDMIPAGASVAVGGSMTMVETGILESLYQGDVDFIDRYEKGISPEEVMNRLRMGLTADYFISGVNGISEDGQLIFVDSTCNRVAPILFGPKKVILISGCNKICPDADTALRRVSYMAAPVNAKRLDRKTPCAATGVCHDCDSPDRICNATVVIHKQVDPQRMHVVLVGEDLGY